MSNFKILLPKNEKIFRFVEQFLFDLGYDWYANTSKQKPLDRLPPQDFIFISNGQMWVITPSHIRDTPTLLTTLTELLYIPKVISAIKVGEHTIEFEDTGLKIGCVFINWKTCEEIYERIKDHIF